MNYIPDQRVRDERINQLRHEAEQYRLAQSLKNEQQATDGHSRSLHKTVATLTALVLQAIG